MFKSSISLYFAGDAILDAGVDDILQGMLDPRFEDWCFQVRSDDLDEPLVIRAPGRDAFSAEAVEY
jgi:hypothetical protein